MRSKSVRNLSEIKQSPAKLLIILRIFARYVAPWPWPLTSWPWFFNSITGIIRLNSTEYERNRIIHGWVIDDLARFRRAILGSGDRAFLGVRGPSFTQLGKDIGRSSQHCRIWISCCIFKRGGSKLSDVEKRRQILHFLTPYEN